MMNRITKRSSGDAKARVGMALSAVCAQWNVNIRYSTKPITRSAAARFIADVAEIKKCLEL